MRNRLFIVLALIIILFAAPAFAQTSQNITLKQGFNFASFTTGISINLQQLMSLNTAIEDVYLYSATAGTFLSYKEGTLSTLSAGKGYIIKSGSVADITISVPGTALSTIGSINLKNGFNLIGFSKVPSTKITFSQLMNTYSLVKGIYKWSPTAGSFISVVRDNSGTPIQMDGFDPEFKAADSYFINVTSDTTINYDGTSILIGASPVDPTAKAAEIAGTLKSSVSMPEFGLNYQAVSGEPFNVTLLDIDGNIVPAASLDSGETNPKTVNDGAAYSFKVKDFTKSYKVIASQTSTNKMISVFVGKVKQEDKITGRDITPISTAISMIYADAGKDASAFKAEEETKVTDYNFRQRITSYVNDLETKRQSIIKDGVYDTPEKLERAYKDAVVGSLEPNEIAKIKEGLDAVIGKLEEQLTMLDKLKDALALIATSGQRQNETSVKNAQSQLETIITSTNNDSSNQEVNKDAKIAYGLVCCDLGEIYKNNVNSSSTASAANARSLMAAYQTLGEENPLAKAEFEKGYNMIKNVTITDNDTANGRDKSLAAAILKNSSELAKSDSAKLDEAKQKADVLISKFETEGTLAVILPTGEMLNKDKILEKKGDALINAGRPSEAVEIFEEISEDEIKNFGLGRAFLGLNDIESAYKTLKDSVKTLVKSNNGAQMRMNEEQKFAKVNEALFAFAAVIDRIKNAPATDAVLTAVKERLISEEQAASSDSEKILVDTNITVGKIIKTIKPTTNFFEIGKKLVLDNPTQQNFGEKFVELKEETDALKKAFNSAMALLFKANQIMDKAAVFTTVAERTKLIYEGQDSTGTVDNPAVNTALKLAKDARTAFETLFNNAAVINTMKGDAHFHIGLSLMANYHALKLIDREDKEILAEAKKIFLEIRAIISDVKYSHLNFAIVEILRNIETMEKRIEGIVSEENGLLAQAEEIMGHAQNFYHGKEYKLAIEEFQKAFDKFEEVYNSTDQNVTIKMKEAALYFGAYCLHLKYKLMSVKDEALKIKLLERLKLFRLKFPESNFVNYVRDLLNELESNIALVTSNDITIDPALNNKPRPGVEFEKVMTLNEKLRLYYKNNFSTSEIENIFTEAEKIFKAIVEDLDVDVKYVGNITGENNLKSLRAMAKFQRAIMYMERYVMNNIKDVYYKNIALKLFNELINDFPEQSFIEEAKRFVQTLQNEGRIVDQFVIGRPIFASINYTPRVIDITPDMLHEINITIDVTVPDTKAVNLIKSVTVELKRFGNPVYLNETTSETIMTALVRNSTNQNRFEGKLVLGNDIPVGVYDAIVFAETIYGVKAEAVFPVIVKGTVELAKIKSIEIVDNMTLKVITEGANTALYVSVMQSNAVSSMYDNKLVPVAEVAAHTKLEAIDGAAGQFILDIKNKLSSLKAGNYIFLFKLVSSSAADLEATLNNPFHILEFPFFIKQEIVSNDKLTLENAYRPIITNFNDLSKTGTERIAAYEKMFVVDNFVMETAKREAWIRLMDSLDSFKITVEGVPYIEYDPDMLDRVIVRAPWKIEGIYKTNMLKGLFLPDGTILMPPGQTGFVLHNFYIKTNHYFVKTLDGNSWGLSVPEVNNRTDVPVVITDEGKPAITKIAGINVPADGTAVQLGDLTVNPFALIEGTKLNALGGEKRVIKVHTPKLTLPIFLCDNGNIEWTDTVINFNTAPLKGITGSAKFELFDSKYGTVLTIPVEFNAVTPDTPKVIVTEIISGANVSNPFGLVRPFEIDRTKELKLKGDAMKPASGTYSLKYFKEADGGGLFVDIIKSDAANWLNYEITVAASSLPSVENIADYKATALVIWDDTANAPASSRMLVTFKGSTTPSAGITLETVNGQNAANIVTLLPPPDGGGTTTQLIITGKNLKQSNKLRIDLMFFIDNALDAVPVAFNDAAGWGNETISVLLDWSRLADKTNLGAALVIFDEMERREVSARVKVKFVQQDLPQPHFIRIIKGVNNMTSEVRLYEDSWGATPPDGAVPSDVNVIHNTVPMIHMTGDSFGVYLQGAKIKFRTLLKEYYFDVKQIDWLDKSVHAALDSTIASEMAGKPGILSIVDAAGAIVSNRLFVRFVQSEPVPVNFALVSPSFAANSTIPVEFSAAGANVSPELRWTGAPLGTQNFALVCEDPTHDATNPYIHWALFNIPASFTGLAKAVPQGATITFNNVALKQFASYAGKIGYDGPNPPTGEVHVYNFKLYALKAVPGALVTDMNRLKIFINANVIGEPAVLRGVFTSVPAVSNAKYFILKTAPKTLPAAPSMQTGDIPGTVNYNPELHNTKVYDQLSGTVYPTSGDPTDPAGYVNQIPIDGTPKVIILEIIEKTTGNVLARNIVGKCPLIEEIPAEVKALELQNPPLDIKTTMTSMLAFEKLGSGVPNLPPFDFKNMTPLADGVISKLMQSTDATAFMTELQKAVGGSGVVDQIMLARQGVKDAQDGITQLRAAATQIRNITYPPNTSQNIIDDNNNAAKGLEDGAVMIENCMAGIKSALNKVPTSNIPNPAATTELLEAYVRLLNEIPLIEAHFTKLSNFGVNMPQNMFSSVPSKIEFPGAAGAINTIDKNTTAARIKEFVQSIPSQGISFQ